jgi:anti-sigma factor RsiW
MNHTHPDEIALTRWLDGEMDSAEQSTFEARLHANPELRREAHAMKELSASLQAEFPRITEVPHADFFNSQIQERIGQLDREERREAHRKAPARRWTSWLPLPWLVGGAAASIALFAIMARPDTGTASVVLSTYAPNAAIQPRTYHSAEANATVLMLDGLENIPADRIVVGFHVDHSDTQQELAMTTLYSAAGEPLMVLDVDGRGQPHLAALQ